MRRLLAAAAITTFALFSAACGSDDKESDSTEAAAAPDDTDEESTDDEATDDESTDETTDAVDDTEADDTEDTEAAEPVEDQTERCIELRDKFVRQLGATPDFEQMVEALEELKEITPDDIDDDLDFVRESYSGLLQLLEEYEGDMTAAMSDPEVMAEFQALSTPEVSAASERITAYFDEACPGVD